MEELEESIVEALEAGHINEADARVIRGLAESE
mgnify:FL=1